MAKVIIKSEKITPYGGICYASKVFSRLLNLNPQWGKGRCVLFFTSLDFYRADMRMRTMKIQIFYGNTLSANLRKSKKNPSVCNKMQTLSLV